MQCAAGTTGAGTLRFAPYRPVMDCYVRNAFENVSAVDLVWTVTWACLLLAAASLGRYAFLATKSPWAIILAAILIFALAFAFVRLRVKLIVALSDAGMPGRKIGESDKCGRSRPGNS